MKAPMIGTTREDARAAADREHAEQRAREAACRLDFLVYGVDGDEEHGPHAERCICSPKCSRNYDPLPYPEAEPVDLRLYEGTAIGALYGHGSLAPWAGRLAGWNLTPRSERYE